MYERKISQKLPQRRVTYEHNAHTYRHVFCVEKMAAGPPVSGSGRYACGNRGKEKSLKKNILNVVVARKPRLYRLIME
jgi:hypothetical protein